VTITYDPANHGCVGTPPPPVHWPRPPTGPSNVTATSGPASKQITLGWSPAQPNGSAITSYIGRCAPAAANPGLPTRSTATGGGKTALLMGGLVASKKYECTVRAGNAVGEGPAVTSTPLVVTAKA
jgi:hypothetical protein